MTPYGPSDPYHPIRNPGGYTVHPPGRSMLAWHNGTGNALTWPPQFAGQRDLWGTTDVFHLLATPPGEDDYGYWFPSNEGVQRRMPEDTAALLFDPQVEGWMDPCYPSYSPSNWRDAFRMENHVMRELTPPEYFRTGHVEYPPGAEESAFDPDAWQARMVFGDWLDENDFALPEERRYLGTEAELGRHLFPMTWGDHERNVARRIRARLGNRLTLPVVDPHSPPPDPNLFRKPGKRYSDDAPIQYSDLDHLRGAMEANPWEMTQHAALADELEQLGHHEEAAFHRAVAEWLPTRVDRGPPETATWRNGFMAGPYLDDPVAIKTWLPGLGGVFLSEVSPYTSFIGGAPRWGGNFGARFFDNPLEVRRELSRHIGVSPEALNETVNHGVYSWDPQEGQRTENWVGEPLTTGQWTYLFGDLASAAHPIQWLQMRELLRERHRRGHRLSRYQRTDYAGNPLERRAFIDQIMANPDDTTTALVFADWLDDNGESPLAEVIRGHVAAHNTSHDTYGVGRAPGAWAGRKFLHGGRIAHDGTQPVWAVDASEYYPYPEDPYGSTGVEWSHRIPETTDADAGSAASVLAARLLAAGHEPHGGSYWQHGFNGYNGLYTHPDEREFDQAAAAWNTDRLSRYARAPWEEVAPFFNNPDDTTPGSLNPSVSDMILADKLADYGDPLEHVVRQDLAYREHPNGFHAGLGQHEAQLLAGSSAYHPFDPYVHRTPEGGRVEFLPLSSAASRGQLATHVSWFPMNNDYLCYVALMPTEEANALRKQLESPEQLSRYQREPVMYWEEQDFLNAINANPLELTHHNALADWLMETRGESDPEALFRSQVHQSLMRRLSNPWTPPEYGNNGHSLNVDTLIPSAHGPLVLPMQPLRWDDNELKGVETRPSIGPRDDEPLPMWLIHSQGPQPLSAPTVDAWAAMRRGGTWPGVGPIGTPFGVRHGHSASELTRPERLYTGIDDLTQMEPSMWPYLEAIMRHRHDQGEQLSRYERVDYGDAEDREAFESSINREPRELTNRLVFADWLADQDLTDEEAYHRAVADWVAHRMVQPAVITTPTGGRETRPWYDQMQPPDVDPFELRTYQPSMFHPGQSVGFAWHPFESGRGPIWGVAQSPVVKPARLRNFLAQGIGGSDEDMLPLRDDVFWEPRGEDPTYGTYDLRPWEQLLTGVRPMADFDFDNPINATAWDEVERALRERWEHRGNLSRYGRTDYGDADDERAFHDAIGKNPLELTNHLVLADWLADRGDSRESLRRAMADWVRGRLNPGIVPMEADGVLPFLEQDDRTGDDRYQMRTWDASGPYGGYVGHTYEPAGPYGPALPWRWVTRASTPISHVDTLEDFLRGSISPDVDYYLNQGNLNVLQTYPFGRSRGGRGYHMTVPERIVTGVTPIHAFDWGELPQELSEHGEVLRDGHVTHTGTWWDVENILRHRFNNGQRLSRYDRTDYADLPQPHGDGGVPMTSRGWFAWGEAGHKTPIMRVGAYPHESRGDRMRIGEFTPRFDPTTGNWVWSPQFSHGVYDPDNPRDVAQVRQLHGELPNIEPGTPLTPQELVGIGHPSGYVDYDPDWRPKEMMPEDFYGASRYQRVDYAAPPHEFDPFFSQHREQGGYDNPQNFADLLLADKLADYDDPRELIVRRELQHREHPHGWLASIADALRIEGYRPRLTGNRTWAIPSGELQALGSGNGLVHARWMHQAQPNPGYREQYDAALTPDEFEHILNHFGHSLRPTPTGPAEMREIDEDPDRLSRYARDAHAEALAEGRDPDDPDMKELLHYAELLEATNYGDAEDELAFLQSIWNDPRELTNHLVLADWYDDHDRPDDASFRRHLAALLRHRASHPVAWPHPSLEHQGLLAQVDEFDPTIPTRRTLPTYQTFGTRGYVTPLTPRRSFFDPDYWEWAQLDGGREEADLQSALGLAPYEAPEIHGFRTAWLDGSPLTRAERLWTGIDGLPDFSDEGNNPFHRHTWAGAEEMFRREHRRRGALVPPEFLSRYGRTDYGDAEDELAFLQSIRDRPQELSHHLVLADWYADHDRPEHEAQRRAIAQWVQEALQRPTLRPEDVRGFMMDRLDQGIRKGHDRYFARTWELPGQYDPNPDRRVLHHEPMFARNGRHQWGLLESFPVFDNDDDLLERALAGGVTAHRPLGNVDDFEDDIHWNDRHGERLLTPHENFLVGTWPFADLDPEYDAETYPLLERVLRDRFARGQRLSRYARLDYGAPSDVIHQGTFLHAEGGAFDAANTPDAVFADMLADHDDPREMIVRRDLSYRGQTIDDFYDNDAAHREQLAGGPVVSMHDYYTNPTPRHDFVDRTGSIEVESYGHTHKGPAVVHRVRWDAPNQATYIGNLTNDELAALLAHFRITRGETPAGYARTDYGVAPADQVLQFAPPFENAVEGFAADVYPHHMLADFLNDHDDPRETIVRRDLEYRGSGDMNEWWHNSENHLAQLLGSSRHVVARDHPHYGRYVLPDRSGTFDVEPYVVRGGDEPGAYRVLWELGNNNSLAAYLSPEEYARLIADFPRSSPDDE